MIEKEIKKNPLEFRRNLVPKKLKIAFDQRKFVRNEENNRQKQQREQQGYKKINWLTDRKLFDSWLMLENILLKLYFDKVEPLMFFRIVLAQDYCKRFI